MHKPAQKERSQKIRTSTRASRERERKMTRTYRRRGNYLGTVSGCGKKKSIAPFLSFSDGIGSCMSVLFCVHYGHSWKGIIISLD